MKRKILAVLLIMTLTLSGSMAVQAGEFLEKNELENSMEIEKENDDGVPDLGEDNKTDTKSAVDDTKQEMDNVSVMERKETDDANFLTNEIAIDEEHFPDANFREYIKEYCDTDGNGSLGQDEIIAVEEISLSSINGKIFSNVVGIEYFTKLKKFDCFDCQLTSLDVSKNMELEVLVCSKNQLTSLDVSNNVQLVTLQVWGNQLTSLNVSNNKKLSFLVCSKNPLEKLDVSNLSSLVILDCGDCKLTT